MVLRFRALWCRWFFFHLFFLFDDFLLFVFIVILFLVVCVWLVIFFIFKFFEFFRLVEIVFWVFLFIVLLFYNRFLRFFLLPGLGFVYFYFRRLLILIHEWSILFTRFFSFWLCAFRLIYLANMRDAIFRLTFGGFRRLLFFALFRLAMRFAFLRNILHIDASTGLCGLARFLFLRCAIHH